MIKEQTSTYPPPAFVEPLPEHFLYVGLSVAPPARGPIPGRSERRDAVLDACRALVRDLPEGVRGTVFRTVLMPPIDGVPRWDVVLLLRGTDPAALEAVRRGERFAGLGAADAMSARTTRRFGETGFPDGAAGETYLFNHFTAPDPETALAGWEEVSGWFTAKCGVDNSVLLQPDDSGTYAVVNHVRLPVGPLRFVLNQQVRPSFHRYVRRVLRNRGMVALPLIVRPV